MTTTYTPFSPPHLLKEYLGKPGHEISGLALSMGAMDALAESRVRGYDTLVVQGRWDIDDRFYLDFAVPTRHIEETTNHRWDQSARRLRLICPECDGKDGKHLRGCAA
jgi:hypothetical protein